MVIANNKKGTTQSCSFFHPDYLFFLNHKIPVSASPIRKTGDPITVIQTPVLFFRLNPIRVSDSPAIHRISAVIANIFRFSTFRPS